MSTTFLAVLLLVAVHVGAGKLRVLRVVPRSPWLSFAGGVGIAYVFARILPELAKAQAAFDANELSALGWLEQHVYLLALAGFVGFYVLERAVTEYRSRVPAHRARPSDAVFWVHMASFAMYNGLIGYLLSERAGPGDLAWFSFAMALHFMVTDHGLREDHEDLYRRYGRWILAAAIAAGWAVSTAWSLSERAVAAVLGFLAGAIVLNVIKEELPRERQSRIGPLLAGAGLYAALLVALAR